MHVLHLTLAITVILSLLVNVLLAAPYRSDQASQVQAVRSDGLLQQLVNARSSLSRTRRSFAQLHTGRNRYYSPRDRWFLRRLRQRNRRRHIHRQGAGQTVYE